MADILSPKNSGSGIKLSDAHNFPHLFGNWSNDSGIDVNEKRSLMHTGVWRAVTLLGGAVATQPKHLMRRSNKKREVAKDHPAHWLVYNKPNRIQNHFQFHFMAVVHLLLWGNFYAYINRDRWYEPSSLIPIMPWECRPEIEGGRKVFYVGGRKYTNNEILHVFGLSFDGVKGVSPIRYTAESIGIGLAAQKMESSSFGKGLHAGGMIELPPEYAGMMGSTDDEAKEYMGEVRDSIRKLYRSGPDSWHDILLLEPGWKFNQFKLSFEIEKLVANKKFTLADVARIFGVPLHKLMEMDKATFSNIEHQGIEYVQDGVMPLTMNFEAEYNDKLLKESEKFEHFFRIDLKGLMRADIKSRFEAYSIMLGRNAPGWAESAEIRELEDMDEGNPENWAIPQNMDLQKDRQS